MHRLLQQQPMAKMGSHAPCTTRSAPRVHFKWLPAHLRSKNPGSSECLDVQIETSKGPRDKCDSPAVVKAVIKDLRETVHALMDEMGVSRAGSLVSMDTNAAVSGLHTECWAACKPSGGLLASGVVRGVQMQR